MDSGHEGGASQTDFTFHVSLSVSVCDIKPLALSFILTLGPASQATGSHMCIVQGNRNVNKNKINRTQLSARTASVFTVFDCSRSS